MAICCPHRVDCRVFLQWGFSHVWFLFCRVFIVAYFVAQFRCDAVIHVARRGASGTTMAESAEYYRRSFKQRRPLCEYDTTRRHLRAATQGDLDFPRTRTVTFGSRAFAVSGPICWNALYCHP